MAINFSATQPAAKSNGIAARAIAARDGVPAEGGSGLPAMVKRAASQLASASSAAEILEARETASHGYSEAKRTARLAKAKGAHDEIIANIHRRQADFLEIEAAAKRRLADEYDAAQERGEVAKVGQPSILPEGKDRPATAADVGVSYKDLHEARQIRDAEIADPGVVRRTLDAKLEAGQEPTKAALREAVSEAAKIGATGPERASGKNPHYRAPTASGAAWTHLYGVCRALSEWATAENLMLALHGHAERDDDQAANIAALIKANETLSKFLGDINAQ